MRVLLLEDDHTLAQAMSSQLSRRAFAVDHADTLEEASWLIDSSEYDCLVMDRMVPGGDSLEFLRKLRQTEETVPALVVTGLRTNVGERVAGFEAGADDYLVKPFSLEEMAQRVLALCRRAVPPRAPVLHAGPVALDTARRTVYRDGTEVVLTAKELAILELLMTRPGDVISREELVEHCWGERESPFSNVVNVHMASLRQKLAVPGLIRTHRGKGYSLGTAETPT